MTELMHYIGVCPCGHSHFDLMDLLAMGTLPIAAMLSWLRLWKRGAR